MDLRRDSQEDTSESPGFSRGEEVKYAPSGASLQKLKSCDGSRTERRAAAVAHWAPRPPWGPLD